MITEYFIAFFMTFMGVEQLPIQWQPYFRESQIGQNYFVMVRRSDGFLMMSDTEMEVTTNSIYYDAVNSGNYKTICSFGRGIALEDYYLDFSKFDKRIIFEKYDDVISSFPITDKKSVIIKADVVTDDLKELCDCECDLIWDDITEGRGQSKNILAKNGKILYWNMYDGLLGGNANNAKYKIYKRKKRAYKRNHKPINIRNKPFSNVGSN